MKKNKVMKILIFLVVLLLPFIYGFFYLKSYWDPYGNLQDLPVAIVNLDKGEDGTNQGDELVKSLIESDSVKILEVSEQQAQDGLVNGEYYAKIVIPEDFTESLNNAENIDREKTVITFSPNKKTNYLAYQIINNVVSKTELSLQGKIANQVVTSLKEKLEEVPDKMEEINDGISEVLEGVETLESGAITLADGTNTLQENYETFDEGVNQAYSGSLTLENGINDINTGSSNLNDGINTLDNAIKQIEAGTNTLASKTEGGISSLSEGVVTLASGSSEFSKSLQEYIAGVDTLNSTTEQLLKAIVQIGNTNSSMLQDEDFAKLYYTSKKIIENESFETINQSGTLIKNGYLKINLGITNLNDNMSGINQISQGLNSLNSSISSLSLGFSSLVDGSKKLNDGTNQILNGSKSLESGLSVLNTSSNEVKNGIIKLNNGSKELAEGTTTLKNGVTTLQNKVDEGIDSTKQELTKLEGLPEYTQDSIEIKEESYGNVKEYGISFTPLFLSIGLWVGALMAYVVFYYDQEKRYKLLGKYADNKFLQIGLYFGIAIIQGLITGILLKLGLGFSVQNTVLYYASCILIAITFMSIIQFLIMNFGDVGKFIALVILVLQLAASGGTFPVETINKGFQALTNFLPMTYSIKLLKETLIIMDKGFATKNIAILLMFAIIPLAITIICTFVKKRKLSKN